MSFGRLPAFGAAWARFRAGWSLYGPMQLLGAWMISTPLLRAAATARFITGASSPTRRVAPLHQCLSHMSQMMRAVFEGCHSTAFSLTLKAAFDPVAGTAS